MKLRSLALSLMTALPLLALADLPPLVPRSVLFGNPDKASPRISPDGKKLAYLAPDNDVLNVWVRTLGQNDDQVVTADKKRGIRIFFWQPDSQHILYLQDTDGDENWHLFQTSLRNRNTRDLTPFQGVQTQVVAVDPNFPDQLLVALNLEDRKLHDVYRVHLQNGAVDLDTKNPGDVAGWTADNAMQIRVASVFLPDGGTELRLRDDPRSSWRTFQKWSADETFGGVAAFTPNNRGAYVISSVDANAARLVEFDLASDQNKVIAEDPNFDASEILTHPTKRHLEAVSFVRAREEWTLIDPALKPDFEALAKIRAGDFSVVSRDLADRTWVVAYVVDDGPVYYYLYDRATRQGTLLFSNRAELEKHTLASMKPVSFPARDGLILHGYLTLPPGVKPASLPMILNVHGGPWARDVWGLDTEAQWLANRGYAVLQVNFRGSTGYGKKFLNAGDREWAGKMHDDLLDAKRWAVTQGYADPKRICIYGGSYGGYATLVGLTFTPDEFSCGVDIVGPSSIVTLINSIPPYWAPLKSMFDKRVGNVETEVEFLNSRSPLFKADQIRVPLLIAQGANDPRVKQAESDQIVAAARKNGKPVEYLVFPDEGHGFARPENRLKFYAAAEKFLAQHLGGRAEPPAKKESWDELKH
jgi:dipeptidyl aminopeptidase/acylaminoacyl peptidase